MSTRPSKSRALRADKRNTKWKRHPQDWYVEPIWCDVRLFEVEHFAGRIWDPAAGIGRILGAARLAGHKVIGSDIVDRNHDGGFAEVNFLTECDSSSREPNIVCNPPYRYAGAFVYKALKLAERKVAMLLPAAWVQGVTRSRWLETTPLRRVWFLAPRPSMPPGPIVVKGGPLGGSGTTDFAWFVWARGYDGHPEVRWLRRDDGVAQVNPADPPVMMGPEERARHAIKANGKLQKPTGLPLFGGRRA